jgi:prepilin-type N-terminal cleavage/methylation domain-containing protein
MTILKRFTGIASTQRGYSLVEISVALAIIAVILVGGLMGARHVLLSNSVNGQIRETSTVVTKLQRQYAKQPNTAGASTSILAPLGIWPSERATGRNGIWTVRGVFSGSSEHVFSNDSAIGNVAANSGFIYTLRQIPVDACSELVTSLDSMAYAIYTGVTAAAPTSGTTPSTTVVKAADTNQVNLTELAKGCSPNTSNAVDVSIVLRQ